MAIHALVPAAGAGTRIGAALPKQYCDLAGKPLIAWALDAFAASPEVAQIFVVISADDTLFDTVFDTLALPPRVQAVRAGGATRHASVLGGLDALSGRIAADDWVLVHDAARPGLTPALIRALIDSLRDDPVGGILALPVADTLKRAGPDSVRIGATVERAGLWQAQTPQMFRYALLRHALRIAIDNGSPVTDEASAIEALGHAPRLVVGSPRNFKVTWPDDLELAGRLLGGNQS